MPGASRPKQAALLEKAYGMQQKYLGVVSFHLQQKAALIWVSRQHLKRVDLIQSKSHFFCRSAISWSISEISENIASLELSNESSEACIPSLASTRIL